LWTGNRVRSRVSGEAYPFASRVRPLALLRLPAKGRHAWEPSPAESGPTVRRIADFQVRCRVKTVFFLRHWKYPVSQGNSRLVRGVWLWAGMLQRYGIWRHDKGSLAGGGGEGPERPPFGCLNRGWAATNPGKPPFNRYVFPFVTIHWFSRPPRVFGARFSF